MQFSVFLSSAILTSPYQANPPHSPAFFPLPLNLFFLPLFSSAMFLASRCLTYFLRLLQCSPPLYHENTHPHTLLNHPPTSTPIPAPPPVPGKQDSPNRTRPRMLPYWAEQQKTSTWINQGNKESFALRCYALIFFMFTVAIIPYDDINDVSNAITIRLRR